MRERARAQKWKRRGQSDGIWEEVELDREEDERGEEEEEREGKLMNLISEEYF